MAGWEQACRQSWRALALVINAKLEAVEAGITSFEDEFMAHIVTPDGHTVATHIKARIPEAYAGGEMRVLLPPPRPTDPQKSLEPDKKPAFDCDQQREVRP